MVTPPPRVGRGVSSSSRNRPVAATPRKESVGPVRTGPKSLTLSTRPPVSSKSVTVGQRNRPATTKATHSERDRPARATMPPVASRERGSGVSVSPVTTSKPRPSVSSRGFDRRIVDGTRKTPTLTTPVSQRGKPKPVAVQTTERSRQIPRRAGIPSPRERVLGGIYDYPMLTISEV